MQQDGTKKPLNVGKKESIPMENMHELLVGTLPSYIILHSVIPRKNPY